MGVALLAEGVDRNLTVCIDPVRCIVSLSSRRAWIEIGQHDFFFLHRLVALLAEGVDRNVCLAHKSLEVVPSLSSRRAWIEILIGVTDIAPVSPSLSSRRAWIEIVRISYIVVVCFVALLAEGVDRNIFCHNVAHTCKGRSPRGGRG